jgi:hypothetical protein
MLKTQFGTWNVQGYRNKMEEILKGISTILFSFRIKPKSPLKVK